MAEDDGKIVVGAESFATRRLLGVGSQGKVYLVQLEGTDEFYAMKVFRKHQIMQNEKTTDSILTEHRFLATSKHPFITKLLYSFHSAERLFMIMEYCPGGELFTAIKKQPHGRLTEEQVKFYASEVILVLEYVHSKGYIYRDLKPENILLHLDGHIRMADFGLSKQNAGYKMHVVAKSKRKSFFGRQEITLEHDPGEVVRTNSLVGSVHYLAPEVLQCTGYDAMADWWALGVLIYDMLFGFPPFQGQTNHEVFTKILNVEYYFPDMIPVSNTVKDLIRKLLKLDPRKRLGVKGGSSEIKKHPFFTGIHWGLLRNRKPPIIPVIHSPDDTSNFMTYEDDEDQEFEYFTELEDDVVTNPSQKPYDKKFAPFSFSTEDFQGSLRKSRAARASSSASKAAGSGSGSGSDDDEIDKVARDAAASREASSANDVSGDEQADDKPASDADDNLQRSKSEEGGASDGNVSDRDDADDGAQSPKQGAAESDEGGKGSDAEASDGDSPKDKSDAAADSDKEDDDGVAERSVSNGSAGSDQEDANADKSVDGSAADADKDGDDENKSESGKVENGKEDDKPADDDDKPADDDDKPADDNEEPADDNDKPDDDSDKPADAGSAEKDDDASVPSSPARDQHPKELDDGAMGKSPRKKKRRKKRRPDDDGKEHRSRHRHRRRKKRPSEATESAGAVDDAAKDSVAKDTSDNDLTDPQLSPKSARVDSDDGDHSAPASGRRKTSDVDVEADADADADHGKKGGDVNEDGSADEDRKCDDAESDAVVKESGSGDDENVTAEAAGAEHKGEPDVLVDERVPLGPGSVSTARQMMEEQIKREALKAEADKSRRRSAKP